MRILHTADWHWGDRLGGFDRTDDIRRVVQQIAGYCESERVDVLLIAGDLFSEVLTRDGQQRAIADFNSIFRPFLQRNGTIVALTGNHDNDVFCRTLREAFRMAAPLNIASGGEAPRGRFHLAVNPMFFTLRDDQGAAVQFVLMPYPHVSRYLESEEQRYAHGDERSRRLSAAFQATLREIQGRLNNALPSVLAAHVYVQGSTLNGAYKLSEAEDVVFSEAAIPTGWAYTALGHVHQAQTLSGLNHVRYCGSPERLDMGEKNDVKGCVVFDVGSHGLAASPRVLPLDATPFYQIEFNCVHDELSLLKSRYSEHERAYVKFHAMYRPGVDDRLQIEATVRDVFPRCYDLRFTAIQAAAPRAEAASASRKQETLDAPAEASVPSVVRQFLAESIAPDDVDREALLALAEKLLEGR